MKDQRNEEWLDEVISRTINTTEPQFDADSWEEKYSEEFEILKARAGQKPASAQPSIWTIVWRSRLAKLAAAAVIIMAIGLFIFHLAPDEQGGSPKISEVVKSPTEMLTVRSLTMAYRRGGLEEVERQCDEALKMLGPPPERITVKQLLAEFNGA